MSLDSICDNLCNGSEPIVGPESVNDDNETEVTQTHNPIASDTQMEGNSPQVCCAQPPAMFAGGTATRIHWKRQNDSIRLIHIITSDTMRNKFICTDRKQSREQLDSGKVDKKVFWEEVVTMFNDIHVSFELGLESVCREGRRVRCVWVIVDLE